MKRLPLAIAAFLTGAFVIGIGLTFVHPHLLPAWARIGRAASEVEGRDAARSEEGREEGEEADHGKGEHADEATLSAEAVKQNGILVAPAEMHALVPTFIAPARVAYNAETTAHVGTPVTGRVAELRARIGDVVKKGDILIVLESPELVEAQSEYLQRLTTARTAAPAVDIARSSFERAERVRVQTSGGIALSEVQKRQAELKSAEAALQSAQTAVTAGESKLRQLGMDQAAITELARTGRTDPRYSIVAPIPGQVVEREITLGELVDPQQEALLDLADLTTVWVLADVPEGRSRDVEVGARARVLTAEGNQQALEGTVSFLAPAIDRDTRTLPVRIVVRQAGTTLRPGMFVRAEIAVTRPDSAPEKVLAVPEAAIQTVEGSPAVFVPVAGEENTFAARAVVAGPAVGGMVPILEGLKAGERIVVAGSFILKAELGKGSAAHEH
jgi:cobalt-zinc-cadmium efflux system membrane fusion protein